MPVTKVAHISEPRYNVSVCCATLLQLCNVRNRDMSEAVKCIKATRSDNAKCFEKKSESGPAT